MCKEKNQEIKYPICPFNMYFEGDEDKCDTSKCDFENRHCTEACKREDILNTIITKLVDAARYALDYLKANPNEYSKVRSRKLEAALQAYDDFMEGK